MEGDDESDDDDGEMEYTPSANAGGQRLWRSAEARARWQSVVTTTNSTEIMTMALASLRDHTKLFVPIQLAPRNSHKKDAGKGTTKAKVLYASAPIDLLACPHPSSLSPSLLLRHRTPPPPSAPRPRQSSSPHTITRTPSVPRSRRPSKGRDLL